MLYWVLPGSLYNIYSPWKSYLSPNSGSRNCSSSSIPIEYSGANLLFNFHGALILLKIWAKTTCLKDRSSKYLVTPIYKPWNGHLEGEQPHLLSMIMNHLLTRMILQVMPFTQPPNVQAFFSIFRNKNTWGNRWGRDMSWYRGCPVQCNKFHLTWGILQKKKGAVSSHMMYRNRMILSLKNLFWTTKMHHFTAT